MTAYEILEDAIAVAFQDGGVYLYTGASAGPENLERMKVLAREGRGLSTFISRSVRDGYALRLR